MNLPRRWPSSSRRNCAHRSISPLAAGVPVSPTIRVRRGRTAASALNLCARWFLNELSSSMTTMSNGHVLPRCFTSQGTFSRLMTVTIASAASASTRWDFDPTATAMVSPARWSHLVASAGQVSRATRRGATMRTRRAWKESSSRFQMAVKVITVLPRPIPRRITACGWSSTNWVACRW